MIKVYLVYLNTGGNNLHTKRGKNIKNILKWKPISLLNVDYKIWTKVLAAGIKGVLHRIIHPDQNGFVPDWYIGENITEIISTIDKLETEDNPGLLVLVDFFKAFNTLEWSFVKKAFEYLNFPENLIKLVSVIYNNVNSHIVNNGHMSKGFTVTRGVIQRYPLYPCIFVIAAEILAIAGRHNFKIKGITQNGEERKINQFADDTVLIIAGEDESLSEAVKVIDHFKQISGLGMNKNKSTIVRPGSVAHSDLKLLSGKDFNWSEVRFTFLGINLLAETGDILIIKEFKDYNMLKYMEPQRFVNIRQHSDSEINGYIKIDISIVHVAYPYLKLHE